MTNEEKLEQLKHLLFHKEQTKLNQTDKEDLFFEKFFENNPKVKRNLNNNLLEHLRQHLINPAYIAVNPPTYKTHILYLYYTSNCNQLNLNKVKDYAKSNGLNDVIMRNHFIALKKVNYKYDETNYKNNGKQNVLKEFLNSYELLIAWFREAGNNTAFEAVTKDYNELKMTYQT